MVTCSYVVSKPYLQSKSLLWLLIQVTILYSHLPLGHPSVSIEMGYKLSGITYLRIDLVSFNITETFAVSSDLDAGSTSLQNGVLSFSVLVYTSTGYVINVQRELHMNYQRDLPRISC
jgi:hypothetical protein